MKREDLAKMVSRVEPALATRDTVPVFSCLCFEKNTVTAYDDIVAMQSPCVVNIAGGIRGKLLIPWIENTKATEIIVTQNDNDLIIKAGRAELKASLIPSSEFVFQFPDSAGAVSIALDSTTVESIKLAMLSMGTDTAHAWRLGVTVHFGKKSTTLYSSDDKTATKVKVSVVAPADMIGRMTILPPRFCELLVSAAAKDKPEKLLLTEDWVEAQFESGLRLFSRTVEGVDVEQYRNFFSQVETPELTTVPIPPGMERCLKRADILIPFCTKPYTALSVKAGKLHLKTDTNSGAGVATDTITLADHPDVSLNVTPDLMNRALTHAKEMAIIPDTCVLYRNGSFTHLVSPVVEG